MHQTTFVIELEDAWHLVNALLVKEFVPLPSRKDSRNGHGKSGNGNKH